MTRSLACAATRSASRELMCSGSGGVGTSRSASFASRSATACGSGRSWTRKTDSRLRPASKPGDGLVRQDHQLLDQHVRMRLALAPGALDAAATVEAELDLGALDPQRAAVEALAPQILREPADQPQRLGHLGLGLAAAPPARR